MTIESSYDFPVFVSSTCWGMEDLRAELRDHLRHLGYRPFLSSEQGFPDHCPEYAPWESCLAVLSKCFITLVVVDGRYGARMEWPLFTEVFTGRRVSPTHAEFLYSRYLKKRTLVFVRRALMPYYEQYKGLLDDKRNDHERLRKSGRLPLPSSVEFDTMSFIHDVMTLRPIQWVTEFDDVSDLKVDLQAKLVNELAKAFHAFEGDFQTILSGLKRAFDRIPPERMREVLVAIGATKDLQDSLDTARAELADARQAATKKEKDVEELTAAFKKADKTKKKAVKDLSEKLAAVTREAAELRQKVAAGERRVAEKLAEGAFPSFTSGLTITGGASLSAGASVAHAGFSPGAITFGPACGGCAQAIVSHSGLAPETCPQCHRTLCNSCRGLMGVCRDCLVRGPDITLGGRSPR